MKSRNREAMECNASTTSGVARRIWATLALLSMSVSSAPDLVASQGVLSAEQLIEMPEISGVQLAPDGRRVIYALRHRDLAANRPMTSFWHAGLEAAAADSLPIESRATAVRWRPDGGAITYLAPAEDGTTQVWEYTSSAGATQVTYREQSIKSYAWSPDGRHLGFTAAMQTSPPRQDGAAGVTIDKRYFVGYRLLSKRPLDAATAHTWPLERRPTPVGLWIQAVGSTRAFLVSEELEVADFAWSPSGRLLALTGHHARSVPPEAAPSAFYWLASDDLFLFDVDDRRLRVLEAGEGEDYWSEERIPTYRDHTTTFDSPFWAPDGCCIGYFRRDLSDARFSAMPRLGVYRLAQASTTLLLGEQELDAYDPRAFWLRPDTIFVEMTRRASRGIYALALPERTVRPMVDTDDWLDQHSFSGNGRVVAFVRQRIDKPGELNVASVGDVYHECKQLTSLYPEMRTDEIMRIVRMHWTAADGTRLEGWLYSPSSGGPSPTLVFIHGGPGWPAGNRWEPYLSVWPHAFSLYASRGIAVFVPNYRGTASYGKAFRTATGPAIEPVSDVIAGVDTLISRGIADSMRLGIAGHSHGGWLAPLIAVRDGRFVAGSFAEGAGDQTLSYVLTNGLHNRLIQEYLWGGSPYEYPGRYRDLSPVYGFDELEMAALFEAGELSQSLQGLAFATAAWRAGMAHELVIYRGVGHNITQPRVMLEALERNLDWFEFWLLGRERPDASKRAQYERWRRLRRLQEEDRGTR